MAAWWQGFWSNTSADGIGDMTNLQRIDRYQRPDKADPTLGLPHNRGTRRSACNLSLRGDLLAAVIAAAEREGVSRSRYIAQVLQRELAPHEEKTNG